MTLPEENCIISFIAVCVRVCVCGNGKVCKVTISDVINVPFVVVQGFLLFLIHTIMYYLHNSSQWLVCHTLN